jgi:pilus assembly protein CpaC
VRINGFEIPAITTRTVETTVELGSGQSMMIAGLMSNNMQSSVEKMPGAGDLPILGALFRSNGWRKNETELVVVITPYLVKPVDDSKIKLPTDGFNSPNDLQRVLMNKWSTDKGDTDRPRPTVAPGEAQSPEFSAVQESAPPVQSASNGAKANKQAKGSTPGFSFE